MDGPIFRFGQEDLRARSVEPQIFEREYWPMNRLYGSAEILRQYAELPIGIPIPWAVQSLMQIAAGRLMKRTAGSMAILGLKHLAESDLPCLFVVDADQECALRDFGLSQVHTIGSMFHYAVELYRRQGFDQPAPPRLGTIALPDKCDLGKQLDFDRVGYAAKLAALPSEYQPVYVSMHWRDFDRGYHEPYLRAGLRVVSSGHPNEPEFYQRFFDICRQFKYACSNEISTSFALSILSGCHFFYLDGGPVTIVSPCGINYQGPEPMLDEPERRLCVEASPFPPTNESAARQRKLAANFSGQDQVRAPAFFRDLWEPARSALSARLAAVPLRMYPAPAPALFAQWLPAGIDADGWADCQCSIEIPPRPGACAVELQIELPTTGDDPAVHSLAILLDADPALERRFAIVQPNLTVLIPLRKDGRRRRIQISGPPAIPLPGENRHRALRLAGIKWHSGPIEPSNPWGLDGATGSESAPGEKRGIPKVLGWIIELWKRKP